MYSFTMTHSLEHTTKRFEIPDELRTMSHGKFEIVTVGGVSVGRAT